MNNRAAKQLRKIINPENPISRRAYQRAKKHYTSSSAKAKPEFLKLLKGLFESE